MSSKKRTKKGRPAKKGHPPLMVLRHSVDLKLQLMEAGSVTALAKGKATPANYNALLDMRNVTMIACWIKGITGGAMYSYVGNIVGQVLANVKQRFDELGKLGLSGPELEAINVFPSVYRDFWTTQPITTYKKAYDLLQQFYDGTVRGEDIGIITLGELNGD